MQVARTNATENAGPSETPALLRGCVGDTTLVGTAAPIGAGEAIVGMLVGEGDPGDLAAGD
jgi:hypothetical protein